MFNLGKIHNTTQIYKQSYCSAKIFSLNLWQFQWINALGI